MATTNPEEKYDEDDAGSEQGMLEERSFHGQEYRSLSGADNSQISKFSKVMAIVNIVLGLLLATSLGLVARQQTKLCPPNAIQIIEPYSPALEVVVPTVKKFKPELVFQSETSPEVEDAWRNIIGPSGGVVALDTETSSKLANTNHESVESGFSPGKHVYGISMFQQLHCLNVIRKSFYRSQFYPDIDDTNYNHQKNQCLDFLRQAVMCHGDVSMTYWWNEKYTVSEEDSKEAYSPWYKSLSTAERETNSTVMWDVEHTCRKFEPISEWVSNNKFIPAGSTFAEDQQQG